MNKTHISVDGKTLCRPHTNFTDPLDAVPLEKFMSVPEKRRCKFCLKKAFPNRIRLTVLGIDLSAKESEWHRALYISKAQSENVAFMGALKRHFHGVEVIITDRVKP
jgi:hypothetical protein